MSTCFSGIGCAETVTSFIAGTHLHLHVSSLTLGPSISCRSAELRLSTASKLVQRALWANQTSMSCSNRVATSTHGAAGYSRQHTLARATLVM